MPPRPVHVAAQEQLALFFVGMDRHIGQAATVETTDAKFAPGMVLTESR